LHASATWPSRALASSAVIVQGRAQLLGIGGPITVVRRLNATSLEREHALKPHEAYRLVMAYCRDVSTGGDRHALVDIYELVGSARPPGYWTPDTHVLARQVRDAIDRGEVLVVSGWQMGDHLASVRRVPVPAFSAPEPDPNVAPSAIKTTKRHWVEFQFRDFGGRPVAGTAFRMILPDRSDTKGKLDGQGRVRYDDQPGGSATIELADIDEARWGRDEIDAHDTVELSTAASGVDEGEPVTFEIFRRYRERAEDVVATLRATLNGSGRAVSRWTPDRAKAPDDQYIFKVTAAGAWRKSEPLTVHRRPVSAEWWPDVATEGDEVTLRAGLRGLRDGEAAVVIVFAKDWRSGEDAEVQRFEVEVSGGGVEATWTVPAAEGLPVQGDTGRREMYFTVEAGGTHYTSGLLVVFAARSDDEELLG